MEFFDSHAHYDDEKFDDDRYEIIEKIHEEGITKFISAGYDLKSSKKGLELAEKYNYIYTTSGISPNDIKESEKETLEDINKLDIFIKEQIDLAKKENRRLKIVGVGEIGLDYYWNKENK